MDTMTNELGIDVELGTLISGTMRPQDLIPVFLAALETYDPGQHEAFISTPMTRVPAWVQDEGDDCEWWSGEDAGHLLYELFEAMDNAAPLGAYFGAHEGDGSDYGYWMLEEQDHD